MTTSVMPQHRQHHLPTLPSLCRQLSGLALWIRITLLLCAFTPLLFALGPALSLATAALFLAGPRVYLQHTIYKERSQLERQLPAALELLARQLASGRSFRQGLESLAVRYEDPLASRMRECIAEIQVGAEPSIAFTNMANATGSAEYRFAATILTLHMHSGGRIVLTLRSLAASLRQKRLAQEELRAITAQGRMSGIVVALTPAAMSLLVPTRADTQPAWITWGVQTVGWALIGVGLVIIWKMTNHDQAHALFTSKSSKVASEMRNVEQGNPSVLFNQALTRLLARLGRLMPARFLSMPDLGQRANVFCVVSPTSQQLAWAGLQLAARMCGVLVGASAFSGAWRFVGACVGAALGWRCCLILLGRWADRSTRALEDELPAVCEMLAMSVSAGANMYQALDQCAAFATGPLGSRLKTMMASVRLGKPMEIALDQGLGHSGSSEVDEMAATLLEAYYCGGGMVTVLSELATDMRERQRLRLQAQARRIPIKILFPLVFCILPAFIFLTIVPVVSSTVSQLRM